MSDPRCGAKALHGSVDLIGGELNLCDIHNAVAFPPGISTAIPTASDGTFSSNSVASSRLSDGGRDTGGTKNDPTKPTSATQAPSHEKSHGKINKQARSKQTQAAVLPTDCSHAVSVPNANPRKSTKQRLSNRGISAVASSPVYATCPQEEVDEEEARRRARNREATKKSQHKKKRHMQDMERREKELTAEWNKLREEVATLQSEVVSLKTEILRHRDCGSEIISACISAWAAQGSLPDPGRLG